MDTAQAMLLLVKEVTVGVLLVLPVLVEGAVVGVSELVRPVSAEEDEVVVGGSFVQLVLSEEAVVGASLVGPVLAEEER